MSTTTDETGLPNIVIYEKIRNVKVYNNFKNNNFVMKNLSIIAIFFCVYTRIAYMLAI